MRYVLILLVALFTALPASAQIIDTALFMSMSPQYPKPGEPVFVTVQSPLYILSDRVITWRAGGQVILEGEGEKTVRVVAPAAGESATVNVSLSGTDDIASIVIAPASVELIWEADSYAPGLYRGRHLPSVGSTISMQAIPRMIRGGAEIPAADMTYTWRRNGAVVTTASGKGKSTYTFKLSAFSESDTVTVTAMNPAKTAAAEGNTSIAARSPVAHMYFEHPLYGILYHRALTESTEIADTEMSFVAIPYFVQATNPNDARLSYIWRVNRQDIEENVERPNSIVVSAGAAGGSALIELSLTHKENYLFDGRGGWTVTFGSISAPQTEQTQF